MNILISAIGKLGNSPFKLLINEYIKRIPFPIIIKEYDLKIKSSVNNIKKEESKLLLSSCKGYYSIALDEKGEQINSFEFADLIKKCTNNYNKIAFLIGGAYGHSNLIKEQSNLKISLSKMTLPHIMARLVLIEQIYRAYTINNNHPYHKN